MTIRENWEKLLFNCRPTACTLFMTHACNFRCHCCSRAVVGAGGGKEMTLEVVQALCRRYPEISAFTLAGFGEPTLAGAFVEIVRYLGATGKSVHVITNGSNPEPLFACGEIDLTLTISLYGLDDRGYAAVTGVPAFSRVIENFRSLQKVFPQTGFSLILDRSSLADLPAYRQLFDRLQPASLVLVNLLPYGNGPERTEAILTTADAAEISQIRQLFQDCPYLQRLPIPIDPARPEFACLSYNYLINVDGDGNIGGCQRQLGPTAEFGNILVDEDPFNSATMLRLRKRCGTSLLHEQCRHCFGNWAVQNARNRWSRSKYGWLARLVRALS